MTDQPEPDEDIRRGIAAGMYGEAFELVVERYSQKVFHLAFGMLRNETQAEDLAQEVLVKVWKALPGYTGEASLSTWIYAITRNTCLTELKKRSRRPTVSLHDPEFEPALQSLPALQTAEPEAGLEMDVAGMLEQLPEKYRQVITLFYLEQKSYEDVSSLLGLPMGTVKTFLYRAKRELLKIANRRAPVIA